MKDVKVLPMSTTKVLVDFMCDEMNVSREDTVAAISSGDNGIKVGLGVHFDDVVEQDMSNDMTCIGDEKFSAAIPSGRWFDWLVILPVHDEHVNVNAKVALDYGRMYADQQCDYMSAIMLAKGKKEKAELVNSLPDFIKRKFKDGKLNAVDIMPTGVVMLAPKNTLENDKHEYLADRTPEYILEVPGTDMAWFIWPRNMITSWNIDEREWVGANHVEKKVWHGKAKVVSSDFPLAA